MNRLSGEKSAYLKHAADQKIDWHPWSEEAFHKAQSESKPVFLSSGAVWCHWCHVMAGECFFDESIAAILNEKFISIKLDRDERPDVDRRYQMAVAAMGTGGGWPLSVFLTPDKVPFFGGTYFPPEDRMGRPGFKKVLNAVEDLFHSKKDEIEQYTGKLMGALMRSPVPEGDIYEGQVDAAAKSMLSLFDSQDGGFGTAPKFPMPGALDFLINRHFFTGDEAVGSALKKTLDAMACGGFHDQVGGGFHRYSTDKSWIIPHFEKMADDNAWLLRNYLSAYALFGDTFYREVAEGIIQFVQDVLSDPAGGFYSSQDADVTADDEGGYFTWRDEEFKDLLDDDEYEVMSLHLMDEAGAMHHDQNKKVLFAVRGAAEIAEKTGRDINDVIQIVKGGKEKLLRARNSRETPFIDKTIYASINGMFIAVFIHGYRILQDRKLRDFALLSLGKVLDTLFIDNELYHTEGTKAFLDDYVYIIEALLAAYEVTGSRSYADQAERLMEICIDRLSDRKEGGFFDTDDQLLGITVKGVEDMPHPSANSLCVRLLLKLFSVTGKETYLQQAEKALKHFSANAQEMGVHSGYYFSALDAYFNRLKLTLHAAPDSTLAGRAVSLFSPYTDIVYAEDKGYAVPCVREACERPVDSPDSLEDFINRRKRSAGSARK